MTQQIAPSERARALFALGAQAVSLVRDQAITAEDLAAIVAVITALMDAESEEARDAA